MQRQLQIPTMTLFLELVGLMIIIQVTAVPTLASTNKVAEMQLNFWREKLPSVQVPETVAASTSPLTEEEVNRFSKIIKDGDLRFHATQFCNSANLLCYESVHVLTASSSVFVNTNMNSDSELVEMNDIFFPAKELREGGHITLPGLYSPWKAFLPRNISQLIPFTTVALSDVLLPSFGISERSNMALNMNVTLTACEAKTPQGEIKTCTTSIEDMIEFVLSNFTSDQNLDLVFHPAPTTADSGKKARVGKVVERLLGPSNRPPLACHRFVYPYGVFYCHSINGTSIYTVELEVLDNNGNNYNSTALCHPNAQWNGSTYCHLILGDTLLWINKDKHY